MKQNRKRTAALLILMVMLLMTAQITFAEEAVVEQGDCGDCTWTISASYTLTISGDGSMGEYGSIAEIPWCAYVGKIKSVVIEEGVTDVCSYAFANATALKSAQIPSTVKTIGKSAFLYCWQLQTIEIPEGVESINDSAFSMCASLGSISLPSTLNHIADTVFGYCSSLATITLAEENSHFLMKEQVLLNAEGTKLYLCSKAKSGEYAIPNGVQEIADGAFMGCGSLTGVMIPNGIRSIGALAFASCTAMETVHLPEGLTDLGGSAFLGCTSLKTVVIEEGITSLYDRTFYGCTALESVTLPDSLTTIENFAFNGCTSLITIEIPKGVQTFIPSPFTGCTALTQFSVAESNPYFTAVDGVVYSKDLSELVLFPAGRTRVFSVPEGTERIANYAFHGAKGLTTVELPDTLTCIGGYAFYECTGLLEITIPDSVKTMEKYVFFNCTKLAEITLGSGLESIGDCVFINCKVLKEIVIPASVTEISELAFYSTTALTSIEVETENAVYCSVDGILFSKDGTKLIAYPAGRKGAYVIPDTVTALGENAFVYCAGLTSVTIPDSIVGYGYHAFRYCSNLSFSQKPQDLVVANKGGTNLTFSDGYSGACVDSHLPGAVKYDLFLRKGTEEVALNNTTEEPVAQQLKVLVVDHFDKLFTVTDDTVSEKDQTVINNLIWHFTNDLSLSDSWIAVCDEVKESVRNGRRIPDEGYVKQLDETKTVVFSFEGLDTGDVESQDYFGYRIKVNDVGMKALGAQAKIVHEEKETDEGTFQGAGLYTNGIRFGFSLDRESLQENMMVGDYFSVGCVLQLLTKLTGSNEDFEAPMLTVTVAEGGAYSSELGNPVLVTNVDRINDSSNSETYRRMTTDTMVRWTEEMDTAESTEELVALLREAGMEIYDYLENELRIVVYLLFSDNGTLEDAKRQMQADSEIVYRGFLVKYNDESYATYYTQQKANSATRIFNDYNWRHFGVSNVVGATEEELLKGESVLAPSEQ